MNTNQEQIKKWFDQIYRTRGYRYLRPIAAYDIFVSLLAPEPQKMYLDVACGLGLMLKRMAAEKVQVYGIDISEEAVRQSKSFCPEATVLQENAEQLPFQDNTFDYITCIGSLERMLDREKVLKEQLRIAKPDARICYMVRNAENFTWKYFTKPLHLENKEGHQDALNYDQWYGLFESSGFKVLDVYPDHWPYLRMRKMMYPGKTDYRKIRKFPFNIRLAYEFIFFLTPDHE